MGQKKLMDNGALAGASRGLRPAPASAGPMPPAAGLPAIDLAPLLQPEGATPAAQQAVARQLAEASADLGAFYVLNTGIGAAQRAAAFAATAAFFGLPAAAKQAFAVDPSDMNARGFARGFMPMGGESGGQVHEVKEGYAYGFDWPRGTPPENKLQGPNRWPAEAAGFDAEVRAPSLAARFCAATAAGSTERAGCARRPSERR